MKRSLRHSLRAAVIFAILVGVSLPTTLLPTQLTHAQDSDEEIVVVGSRIMEDLVNDLAELYRSETGNDLALAIDAEGGNRSGFESFCNGEADLMMATREITDEEIEACNSNEVDFVETVVALDGLVLAVNEESTVSCVAVERLPNVFLANTEPTWTELDPNFVPPVPEGDEESNTTLTIYGPPTADADRALSMLAALLEPDAPRDDYGKLETLEDVLEALGDSTNNGVAFMTLAQWESLEDTTGIKLLEFNTTSTFECVAPSLGNFSTGDYPAMRALMLYVKAPSLLNNNLSEFFEFSFGGEDLPAEERVAATVALAGGFSAPVQAVLDRDLNNIRGPKVGRTFTRRDTPFTITTAAAGDINIIGSSISSFGTRPVITSFNETYTQVTVNVTASSDDNAWAAFCAGETSVIQTNRLATDEEMAACNAAGIDLYEIYLGSDAVVLLVKSDAGLPQCVDYSEVAGMLVPVPTEEDMSDSNVDDTSEEANTDEVSDEGETSEDVEASTDEVSTDEADEATENSTTDGDEADTVEETPATPVQQAQEPTTWNEINGDWIELPLIVLVPSIGAAETDIVLSRVAPSVRLRRSDSPTVQETPASTPLTDIDYRLGSTAAVDGAVTYISWGDWQANSEIEGLSLLEISNQANGVDCTSPTSSSVQDHSYPLSYSSYLFFSEEGLSDELVSAFLWHTHSEAALDAVTLLNTAGFDRQALELERDDLFSLIEASVPQPEDIPTDEIPNVDTDTPDEITPEDSSNNEESSDDASNDDDSSPTEPTTEILG